MNKISIDIFAETNPAFCSLVIFHFCKGYIKERHSGVPFPILILPLPIILSNDLATSFDRTNVKTGFFRWKENNPAIILNLTKRINDSNEFLKPAIEFGVFKNIFTIDNSGLLILNENCVNKSKKGEFNKLFNTAERFGSWIGQVNSTKTIFNCLGIQL